MNNTTARWIIGGLLALISAIFAYWGKECTQSLANIQRDIADINLQIVRMQAQQLTREDVKEIVEIELSKRKL